MLLLTYVTLLDIFSVFFPITIFNISRVCRSSASHENWSEFVAGPSGRFLDHLVYHRQRNCLFHGSWRTTFWLRNLTSVLGGSVWKDCRGQRVGRVSSSCQGSDQWPRAVSVFRFLGWGETLCNEMVGIILKLVEEQKGYEKEIDVVSSLMKQFS